MHFEIQENYEITAFDAGKNLKTNGIDLKNHMLMCTKIFLVEGSHMSCAPTLCRIANKHGHPSPPNQTTMHSDLEDCKIVFAIPCG